VPACATTRGDLRLTSGSGSTALSSPSWGDDANDSDGRCRACSPREAAAARDSGVDATPSSSELRLGNCRLAWAESAEATAAVSSARLVEPVVASAETAAAVGSAAETPPETPGIRTFNCSPLGVTCSGVAAASVVNAALKERCLKGCEGESESGRTACAASVSAASVCCRGGCAS
jgi:hypothetical protein